MDLKKRLLVSNAVIIVIPIMVTLVASSLLLFVLTRLFSADMSYENIKELSNIHYQLLEANSEMSATDPEKFLERDFQQHLSSRLEFIDSDIIILKNHKIIFETRKLNIIDLERTIEAGQKNNFTNTINLNGRNHVVKSVPLLFKDGQMGNVILISSKTTGWLSLDKLIIIVASIFVLSFLITNILLIINLSKKITRPLAKLQEAAVSISGGDYDFEVVEDGDFQIKELCKAFESMRIKLLESTHNQKKYDETRKMLMSSISHDLKTPITSIKGYVEGILDGVANTPSKMEKYLKTVYLKAIYIDRLIDDLVLYSKLDSNQINFDFEDTYIIKYFEDCIAEVEPELNKSSIDIYMESQLKGDVIVKIDRVKMRRVVINIIENSRKYMDKEHGEIGILLRETYSNVIIELKDNGSGIEEKDIPYVFDRFYRADEARSTMKGSGLGLAIAKQILEGHEGNIWARSTKGKGTSIIMSIGKYGN